MLGAEGLNSVTPIHVYTANYMVKCYRLTHLYSST